VVMCRGGRYIFGVHYFLIIQPTRETGFLGFY